MIIREMTIDDYDEVYEMWQITTKRALSKADEKDQMERYLKHNAGMSQVAVVDGKIVGTVLAGHDGRRGFIHHMAVLPEFRRKKIGHALLHRPLSKKSVNKASTKLTFSVIRTTKQVKASGVISALKSVRMFLFTPSATIKYERVWLT